MATTSGGINFEELEGSPKINISSQGIVATRRFLLAFAAELIGLYRNVGGSVQVSLAMPFPGPRANLRVDTIDVEPFDPGNPNGADVLTLTSGVNRYAAAVVTAVYREQYDNSAHPNFPAVPPGTYVTYSAHLGAEYFTVPGRTWRWTASGKDLPDDLPVGILDPVGHYTLTWHNVLGPPWSAIRSLRGKVNGGAFMGAPAGCLLFLGARSQTSFGANQDQAIWKVEYSFSERVRENQYGWNYFYNQEEDAAAGTHWMQIEDKIAPHNGPYAAGDFSALFAYGS